MDSFDEEFKKGKRFIMIIMICGGTLGIGVIIFFGWVIIKLMQHFKVI